MKRNWARTVRRRGWLLLGVPLLVIGALFICLDYFFDEYLTSLDEAEAMDRRISQVAQMKTYSPRLREIHQLYKPQYQEIEARSQLGTTRHQSERDPPGCDNASGSLDCCSLLRESERYERG